MMEFDHRIDTEEAARIKGAIGYNMLTDAYKHSAVQAIAKDGEERYDAALGLITGRILGRLDSLEYENAAHLPTIDEIASDEDRRLNIGDPASVMAFSYLYNLLWKSYRYGYYQALEDNLD